MDSWVNLGIHLLLFRPPGNHLKNVQDFQRQAVGEEGLNSRKPMEYLFLLKSTTKLISLLSENLSVYTDPNT